MFRFIMIQKSNEQDNEAHNEKVFSPRPVLGNKNARLRKMR
jgi:hypothetical protein